ncbi:MAG: nucleotidyltransferase family protein [Eubacteriales bacterium]|nr:nucleotidyltransferase family protein [Eubacteriales bacterium]
MTAENRCLLALCRAGLLGEKPQCPAPDTDWSKVLHLADEHKVSAMVAEAVLRAEGVAPEILSQAKRSINTAKYFEAVQYLLVKDAMEALAANGVDYCPLKGWRWRGQYPAPYLREMGDVDLLVRSQQWEKAVQTLLAMGFTKSESDEIYAHSVFYKSDVKLELHRTLASQNVLFVKRFLDIWPFLIKTDRPYEWRLSLEDEYLYFFYHTEKHISDHMFILRTLADIWILNTPRFRLDRQRFTLEARQVHLLGCTQNLEKLANTWLSGEAFTPRQEDMLDGLLNMCCLSVDERFYHTARHRLLVNLMPSAFFRSMFPSRLLKQTWYQSLPGKPMYWRILRQTAAAYRRYVQDYFKAICQLSPNERRQLRNLMATLHRE